MKKMTTPRKSRSSSRGLFAQLYSGLMRGTFQKFLLPRFASGERLSQGRQQWEGFFQTAAATGVVGRRVWWHAASVGELEILWPAIIRMAEERGNGTGAEKTEFVVTILSESAQERLKALVRALEKLGIKPVFFGYSPWEGSWRKALEAVRPDLFVTSKYEAWPELWMSLSELGIPLSIVSAKMRRSLKVCGTVCRTVGGSFPRMFLLTAVEEDVNGLKEAFPDAEVQFTGEPRWDQVWNRAQAGNKRAQEIASAMNELPRPWGVLGSAWHEDVSLWKRILKEKACGTVLIVPHRIDSEHLNETEEVLKQAGIRYLKTGDYATADNFRAALKSHADGPRVQCIVVNEMGFLSELYSVADWAYVGGGIGRRGVHSTIEPAIHGIPISCGHYRAHQFVEISTLSASGQLTLVSTEDDLRNWVAGFKGFPRRELWKSEAVKRLGATERIVQRMVGILFPGMLS